MNCRGLTSITIPEEVTSIGDWAFADCYGLTNITIPEEVSSIGKNAFYGCIGLRRITIPDGVTSIGGGAFSECSNLRSIMIPDGVTSILGDTFNGCIKLENITIPDGVTSIGGGAFYGCIKLRSISIPRGVTSIGVGAFSYCSGLTNVTIPRGVTSIGGSAFSYCSGLTNVTIPSGVTSIEGFTFKGCTKLESITIPSGVTSIDEYAFSDCSGLTSIILPDEITFIGNNAFDYSTVYCNKGTMTECSLKEVGIPYRYTELEDVTTQTDAPKEIIDISESENNVEVLKIENKIYNGKAQTQDTMVVMAGDKILELDKDYIVSYTDNVKPGDAIVTITGIGNYKGTITISFLIIVPNTEIVDISNTENNVKVSGVENKIYNGKTQTQDTMVVMAGDKTLELDKDYTVSYIDNVKPGNATVTITGIGNYEGTITRTFSIIAPKTDISKSSSKISVTGIVNQKYTGKKCTQTKLVVKSGSKILKLGKNYQVSYENNVKPGKATVVITGIGNCTGKIKKTFAISIPKNAVYTVGGMKYKVTNAAANGKGSVTIVGTTKKNKAFISLTIGNTVTIGGIKYNITAVGKNAFKNSTYLKKIVIGNTVKTIGSGAFTGCKAVTTLAMGTGVTSVGDKAFYGCTKLKTVTVKSKKITKLGKQSFGKISAKPVVSLPKAKAKSYKKLFKSAGISSKAVYKNMK